MSPRIHILLPVHNRRQITQSFIECLLAQTYKNYHLILIDDGSSDGTGEMVSARVTDLTILRGEGSWWWAGSLQQGIDWLEEQGCKDDEIVAFMNDDVLFQEDFFDIAVRLLEQQEGMLLAQIYDKLSGQVRETGVDVDLGRLQFKIAESAEKINCLPTRGLFMRMSDLRKTGNFHPKLLPHYLSDYEFTIRAHRKGVQLRTSPELLIEMNQAASKAEGGTGSLAETIRRLFSKKNPANPVYWTTFLLLAAPAARVPWNAMRIWIGALWHIFTK